MQLLKTGMKILVIVLTLTPQIAPARGGSNGGGGGAMVRRDSRGQVVDATLLDLWEGLTEEWDETIRRPLNIPFTNEPVEFQISRAMEKLRAADPILHAAVKKDLDWLRAEENIKYISKDMQIEKPHDARNLFKKKGANLEGMMWYRCDEKDNGWGTLNIDLEVYSKLTDHTNRAAAPVHEAVRKVLHEKAGFTDSIEARRIVACMFSSDDCFHLQRNNLDLPLDKKVWKCDSKDYSFYAWFEQVDSKVDSKKARVVSRYTKFLGMDSKAQPYTDSYNVSFLGNDKSRLMHLSPDPTLKWSRSMTWWGANTTNDHFDSKISAEFKYNPRMIVSPTGPNFSFLNGLSVSAKPVRADNNGDDIDINDLSMHDEFKIGAVEIDDLPRNLVSKNDYYKRAAHLFSGGEARKIVLTPEQTARCKQIR